MEAGNGHNPWIPIADLLAGFVFIFLLMFVTAALRIMWLEEKQRLAEVAATRAQEERQRLTFDGVADDLRQFEASGLVRVDRAKSVVALTDLSFETGSACLSPAAAQAVAIIAERLRRMQETASEVTVYVEGHTDPAPVPRLANRCGWFENNTQLSTLREWCPVKWCTRVRGVLVRGLTVGNEGVRNRP